MKRVNDILPEVIIENHKGIWVFFKGTNNKYKLLYSVNTSGKWYIVQGGSFIWDYERSYLNEPHCKGMSQEEFVKNTSMNY